MTDKAGKARMNLKCSKVQEAITVQKVHKSALTFSAHEPSFHNHNLWMRKNWHQEPHFPEGYSGKIPY